MHASWSKFMTSMILHSAVRVMALPGIIETTSSTDKMIFPFNLARFGQSVYEVVNLIYNIGRFGKGDNEPKIS